MVQISLQDCNCFSTRKAARHLTQMYDAILAPSGIRSTQFMIMMTIRERSGLSVNELAAAMSMDRTTMGKNLRPLERDGLIVTSVSNADRRSRTAELTIKGLKVVERAAPLWMIAHSRFERKHGAKFATAYREMLNAVAAE